MTLNSSQPNVVANESPQYCTVQQIVNDKTFCFTQSMLRYYILHAHSNGLRKAIRKVGRKVLIRRDLLIIWLEEKAIKGGRS